MLISAGNEGEGSFLSFAAFELAGGELHAMVQSQADGRSLQSGPDGAEEMRLQTRQCMIDN